MPCLSIGLVAAIMTFMDLRLGEKLSRAFGRRLEIVGADPRRHRSQDADYLGLIAEHDCSIRLTVCLESMIIRAEWVMERGTPQRVRFEDEEFD